MGMTREGGCSVLAAMALEPVVQGVGCPELGVHTNTRPELENPQTIFGGHSPSSFGSHSCWPSAPLMPHTNSHNNTVDTTFVHDIVSRAAFDSGMGVAFWFVVGVFVDDIIVAGDTIG